MTPLLVTPALTVGEFDCPPEDASWRETNRIGDRAHVVFPRRSVVIRQVGREPVLATPNHTMLYNADQHYRRELHNALGDHSVFVELSDDSLESAGAGCLDDDGRLRVTHVPTDRRTYMVQHLLARHLRSGGDNGLAAEEHATRLVLSALAAAPCEVRGGGRERTAAAHRELAEAAKSELAADLGARRTLDELARKLHTSPFHLARVFRTETGFSLARYRHALRLRAALERLPTSHRDLSALALELGFSSHSHFTASFTREFGVSPSAVKDSRRVRALLDVA